MPTIALLTDFGTTDAYVGVMKGVIATICPDASVIDVTHAIGAQNVRQGAFMLMTSYTYFPPRTIFVAVVDPGVGTMRRVIAARAGDYTFIAPDNGLLSFVLRAYPYAVLYELTNTAYHLKSSSNTFHGRDIFAPVAAHLARGEGFDKIGTRARYPVMLPQPTLAVEGQSLRGEVLHIDGYGNIVTSIGVLEWGGEQQLSLKFAFGGRRAPLKLDAHALRVVCGDAVINGAARTYGATDKGDLLALVGSNGFVEIAVNQGSAAERLNVKLGDPINMTWE
jgi:S-adenosyl-L-methionine hydrolase (adenosine-forming)